MILQQQKSFEGSNEKKWGRLGAFRTFNWKNLIIPFKFGADILQEER
jgi:hypothetical protein